MNNPEQNQYFGLPITYYDAVEAYEQATDNRWDNLNSSDRTAFLLELQKQMDIYLNDYDIQDMATQACENLMRRKMEEQQDRQAYKSMKWMKSDIHMAALPYQAKQILKEHRELPLWKDLTKEQQKQYMECLQWCLDDWCKNLPTQSQSDEIIQSALLDFKLRCFTDWENASDKNEEETKNE